MRVRRPGAGLRLQLVCAASLALLAGCAGGFGVPRRAVSRVVPDIPVYASTEPPFSCEVVGVLDFHTAETSEDKGFEQLKIAAKELGADAVMSAEFEHGSEGGKSHLSGVAIRRKTWNEEEYVELGKIDIATEGDADDKGYDTLRAQARAMGADRVIDVRFEHGIDGAMSHLTGTAVAIPR